MWFTRVRNVNDALSEFLRYSKIEGLWRTVSPRGIKTMEFTTPFVTVYGSPTQRVLFCPERDANPFFHFFESLWILDGRNDVAFLAQFNAKIAEYSDDGYVFHAPYGERLRKAHDLDQIWAAIEMLKSDPDSRRVVLQIWDADYDLDANTKDIPCNDMIFLKIRDGALNMTVMCRSNDMIWGGYGANAVQFSMLQEFIALAAEVKVGKLYQFSDSYHYYPDTEVWKRIKDIDDTKLPNYYYDNNETESSLIRPFPLMQEGEHFRTWMRHLHEILGRLDKMRDTGKQIENFVNYYPFFLLVVVPMYQAWNIYRSASSPDKNTRIAMAVGWLEQQCKAEDWKLACIQWLYRRREVTT